MPFLRRRGATASESNTRKHDGLEQDNANSNNLSSTSLASSQELSRPGSAAGLTTPAAALSTVQDPAPAVVLVPAPPVTPPSDGMSSSNPLAMSASASELFERPVSPPIQDDTPKHRRFSMLRFRNASDSQLSTRAKQQAAAAAEKPPPIPRRTSRLFCCFACRSFPVHRLEFHTF